jgi:phospholipase/lecithinase/hemolysin
MRQIPSLAAVALATALLAACGGGGSDTAPRTSVQAVKVIGDSLADVGTFGFKATVNGPESFLFVERVAMSYGLTPTCNYFRATGPSSIGLNPTAGCANYAVAGGVINAAGSGLSAADPRGVAVQFAAATSAGNWGANDLLMVDGGGNDAATLVTAYLQASRDGGAAFVALMGTQLSAATINAALPNGATGLATLGTAYMKALADSFANLIQAQALDKGAQRVLVANVPGITNTPRFQLVLDSIGAAGGATARAQSEALFKGWIEAFNGQLAARFAGNAKVVVVDTYTTFNQQVQMPAQFGLSNATTPACPVTGVGTDGLPTYTFASCSSTALSAQTPPAGASGGAAWWQTYAFSDGFHPTPYLHQLTAQLISRSLAAAGWL